MHAKDEINVPIALGAFRDKNFVHACMLDLVRRLSDAGDTRLNKCLLHCYFGAVSHLPLCVLCCLHSKTGWGRERYE